MATRGAIVVATMLYLGIGAPAEGCVQEGGLCGGVDARCCADAAGLACETRGFMEQRCVAQRRLQQCAQDGQPCGGPTQCCDGMHCAHVHWHEHYGHYHGRQCISGAPSPTPAPVCAGEMQTCGGPGLPDTPCCGDMTCESHFRGTENLQCVPATTPAPVCAGEMQTCGGPGLPDTPCCGDMTCEHSSMSTENLQCVPAMTSPTPLPVCAGERQTCGGPGLPDTPCCGDMTCERSFMGTENLQCVPAITSQAPAQQCKARGAICGCAGCQTMTCCGGLHCLEVSGQGGQRYCVDADGVALALAATAAPANATVAQAP